MGFVKCMGKFCVALKIIAVLFHVIAIGIPYWYKGDSTETGTGTDTVKTTTREGLWKTCTDLETSTNSNSFCVSNEATSVIIAIRWVMFISLGFLGIGTLATGAGHLENNRTAFIVGAIHAFINVILNLTNAALYAVLVKDEIGFETKHLYAGWGLVVLAAILSLVAGVMALVLARMVVGSNKVKDDDDDKNDGKE